MRRFWPPRTPARCPTPTGSGGSIPPETQRRPPEEDGAVYGCVNLNGEQLPEYDAIPWSVPAQPSEVGVIHTLVIRPSWSGRGKAREFVAFCEEELRRQGKKTVRLDTYEGNLPANTMYPRLGYRLAGATEFFFQGFIHEILNCYEKAL